jgi:glycosyltransferase involved in cell wall biosynthesis
MVMRKPVVVTDCNGSRELVRDGETGFLVPPGDYRATAERIAYLLDNPREARRMGQSGRKLIEEQFSLNTMVDETVQIYQLAIQSAEGRIETVSESR